jgi:predicted protein tyrosine phosphatase
MDYIIISVTDTSSHKIDFVVNAFCKGVLELTFHDVDSEKIATKHNLVLFTKEQARRILDFVQETNPKLVVIQCEAGISRSAGIAAALSEIHNNHDGGFFRAHIPNMLVFRTILWEHEGFDLKNLYA